jgi:integrase
MKLTQRVVDTASLQPGEKEKILWDTEISGFGLRLRPGGSKTFVFSYRFGRVKRKMKLGAAAAIPMATARKNASDLAAKVHLGEDPQGSKLIAKQETELTFGALAERFLEARRSELRSRTAYEYERHLRRDARSLHNVPIGNVTQADIARLLNSAAGDVTANRLRSTLSAMFGWVLREGVVLPRGNPAAYTNKRKETARERVLSDDEIKTIWHAATGTFGDILKLLLLTGQRASEIAGLRWDEIEGDMIALPSERTKNGRAHAIPLSDPAIAIIRHIPQRHACVFGRDGNGWRGWSPAKERLAAIIGDAVEPWTPHDMRRTAATGMAELGVQPHVVEAVLNHISGHKSGVAGVYNKAVYAKEKREALNLWAEHIMAIVEDRDSTVTPLRRA